MSAYGMGLHLGPNEYFVGDRLIPYLEEMRAMGMTQITTLNKDQYSFELFRRYGFETVLFRPQINCEQLYQDLSGVAAMRAAGLRARTQPYNEPSDDREWPGGRPDNYVETWINRWIDAALRIYHAGGEPGIQCLDPEEELRPLLRRIKETGNEFLFENAWLSIHNYPDSHPPDFGLRPERDGYDVYDSQGWLSFVSPLVFQRVYKEETGREADTYCTEGGWCIGDGADNRFPKITPELHAQYTLEVVKAFQQGKLPDGSPWPCWWKGFTFWLAASTAMGGPMAFEENAWFYSQLSSKALTIDGLRALSGGQPITSTWDEPEPEEPEEEPVPYTYELDFARYAAEHPERVGQPISPLVQIGAGEAVQRTEKGVLWWDGQTTFYSPYANAEGEVSMLRQELAELMMELRQSDAELGQALARLTKIRTALDE